MRYVLAAILVCSVGAPAASALPTAKPNIVSASKSDLIAQAAKRSRPPVRRNSRKSDGGIHPLVGSGGY